MSLTSSLPAGKALEMVSAWHHRGGEVVVCDVERGPLWRFARRRKWCTACGSGRCLLSAVEQVLGVVVARLAVLEDEPRMEFLPLLLVLANLGVCRRLFAVRGRSGQSADGTGGEMLRMLVGRIVALGSEVSVQVLLVGDVPAALGALAECSGAGLTPPLSSSAVSGLVGS